MNIVLTCGRSAPAGSTAVYLDHWRCEVSRGRERVRLWPKAFKMVAAILVSPHRLTTNELISIIYDDDLFGGPEWANRCIWHMMHHARRRLYFVGITIKNVRQAYEAFDISATMEATGSTSGLGTHKAEKP